MASVVPSQLPSAPPADLRKHGWRWGATPTDQSPLVYKRSYDAAFVSARLFAKCMIRGFALARPVQYWRTGYLCARSEVRGVTYMHRHSITRTHAHGAELTLTSATTLSNMH